MSCASSLTSSAFFVLVIRRIQKGCHVCVCVCVCVCGWVGGWVFYACYVCVCVCECMCVYVFRLRGGHRLRRGGIALSHGSMARHDCECQRRISSPQALSYPACSDPPEDRHHTHTHCSIRRDGGCSVLYERINEEHQGREACECARAMQVACSFGPERERHQR